MFFLFFYLIFFFQVRYVGFRDRPLEERQMRFAAGCREGHAEIVSITFISFCTTKGYNNILEHKSLAACCARGSGQVDREDEAAAAAPLRCVCDTKLMRR